MSSASLMPCGSVGAVLTVLLSGRPCEGTRCAAKCDGHTGNRHDAGCVVHPNHAELIASGRVMHPPALRLTPESSRKGARVDVSAGDVSGTPFGHGAAMQYGTATGRRPDRHGQAGLIRHRWRAASLTCGWRFPDDWAVPEVDLVCAAVARRGGVDDAAPALVALAHARAAAGTGLEETLGDLAALHS